MTSGKQRVLAVVGPTASGKTQLGVELAQEYGGEVISADSMQIYKGMDIASAKPTQAEMQGIPHHLIGVIDRDTPFSAADYVKMAREVIADVISRGKLPIIVGGTGLYVDSLLNNVRFAEMKSDPAYREQLYELSRRDSAAALYAELEKADPEAAAGIHMNNTIRVVRALEVIHLTGRRFSELRAESISEESPYDPLIIGLNAADRAKLYERINARVDEMICAGLIEEARAVYSEGNMRTAANAIGYKELIPYFEGTSPLSECIDKIKQETRRYAKRQLTWFRRNERIRWIIIDDFGKKYEILENSKKAIANYGRV